MTERRTPRKDWGRKSDDKNRSSFKGNRGSSSDFRGDSRKSRESDGQDDRKLWAKNDRSDRPKRSFDGRDDRPKRSYGDREDRPKRTFGDRDDRPRRSFSDRDDRPKRTFGDRDDRPKRTFGDRDDRPRRSFDDRGDRPKRTFGDREDRPKRTFGDRDDRPRRSFDDRGDRPKRTFGDREDRPKRTFGDRDDRPRRSFDDRGDRPKRTFGDREDRPKRTFGDRDDRPRRSFDDRGDRPKRTFGDREDRPKRTFGDRDDRPRRSFDDRGDRPKRNYGDRDDRSQRSSFRDNGGFDRPRRRPSFQDEERSDRGSKPSYISSYEPEDSRKRRDDRQRVKVEKDTSVSSDIRLNKFIANSGVCSRREADTYIEAGLVTVNGEVVTELGTKVQASDEIRFNGEQLRGERKFYLLMNKPKGYVTTVEDPHADKTVMDIANQYCDARIYPVGRLDKNSTGVLLLTNDGELTQQLTHPSFNKKKIYQVEIDQPLTKNDMQRVVDGVELEDGISFFDVIEYLNEEKTEFGIEIHSGKNRIIRRMFESMGYKVNKLDRVYFAGLTKKNLKRGECRTLTDKEVSILKMGSYE